MTQISGKLYQMKNAARTENRYPMTVIEGVYGLATYLQQQFGSLADIYMPIEGIHEAKTGQEFVYRQTPNTIGANLLNIDRIKGKTLAWNQLVQNPTIQDTHAGWTCSFDIYGETSDMIALANLNGSLGFYTPASIIVGHKYYITCSVKYNSLDAANAVSILYFGGGAALSISPAEKNTPDYVTKKVLVTANDAQWGFSIYPAATGDILIIDKKSGVNIIDLTLLGIDNLTTVAEVEAWLATNVGLRSYYPFNAGELKSNDAQSIVTVGRNQWDEEWEEGYIETNGSETSYGTTMRSKNYDSCVPGTVYYCYCGSSGHVFIAWYDESKTFIVRQTITNNTQTAPSNARYFKLCSNSDYGPTYNHDICINLSDASFNGQYEPYWKNTLELNIKTLTGKKDGQGASVTIFPDGAGGVGSVYDELRKSVAYKRFGIVDLGTLTYDYNAGLKFFNSNISGSQVGSYGSPANGICAKYPIRSWSAVAEVPTVDKSVVIYDSSSKNLHIRDLSYTDAATFKTAMQGVKLIYQLATPETYVLDTPLVTTMRAGTTEERISPNSDGLSAPFCGDLTYSISSASDALDAQYATAAGRLYNKRKIWGNDFDGTQDVTGLATLGEGAKVSKVFTLPTTPPPAGSVASGEYALYVDPNGNYSQ